MQETIQIVGMTIIALTVTVYPIFIIIDSIRRHRNGEHIAKRFFAEIGIGVLVFLASGIAVASTMSGDDDTTTVVHKNKNSSPKSDILFFILSGVSFCTFTPVVP